MELIAPNAADDTVAVLEAETGGDVDGNVRLNDTNPAGPALPVSAVAGSAANVGVAVAGSDGGTFTINADGTFDFDAAGAFNDLDAGETRTTSVAYSIQFTGTASMLDVVLLQDLSASFGDAPPDVRRQFSGLYDTLNATRDVQFGVASFVDKPVSPFGVSGDYSYATELAVTGDKAAVQAELDGLVVGLGGDFPESQFEALLQLAVRASTAEIGFREGAQRIVVVETDATGHLAGSYSDAPDGPNNGDAVIGNEDYPTLAQVRAALEAADITPIFAVTADVVDYYESIVDLLGRGSVVTLSANSSNLAAGIISELTSGVTTTDTATLTVTVNGEGLVVDPELPDLPILTRPGTENGSGAANDTLTGMDGANTFYISLAANSGQDTITNFASNDIFVTDGKLFDGNQDGFVSFGTNDFIDLDRGLRSGGDDSVNFVGVDPVIGLRYTGEAFPSVYVYAEGSVRPKNAIESMLGDSALAGDKGDAVSDVFFFDTALALDLGNDRITSFGARDVLVLTTKIKDSNNDNIIEFGRDKTLNLDFGTDVVINNHGLVKLEYDGVVSHNGLDYYVYSHVGSTAIGLNDVFFV